MASIAIESTARHYGAITSLMNLASCTGSCSRGEEVHLFQAELAAKESSAAVFTRDTSIATGLHGQTLRPL